MRDCSELQGCRPKPLKTTGEESQGSGKGDQIDNADTKHAEWPIGKAVALNWRRSTWTHRSSRSSYRKVGPAGVEGPLVQWTQGYLDPWSASRTCATNYSDKATPSSNKTCVGPGGIGGVKGGEFTVPGDIEWFSNSDEAVHWVKLKVCQENIQLLRGSRSWLRSMICVESMLTISINIETWIISWWIKNSISNRRC